MPIRTARDVPEARSRLLRFLDDYAPEAWTISLATTGYHVIDRVTEDHVIETFAIPGEDGAPTGAAIPREFMGRTFEETATNLARWQRHAIANSELFYANEAMTAAVMAAADDLPSFEFHEEVLPVGAERGLLCWAAPVSAGENMARRHTTISAVSWCPLVDGLWVTMYVDTATAFRERQDYDPMAVFGWLTETGTFMLPWGGNTVNDRVVNPTLHKAFATMLTTWLFMGQTLTTSTPVEPDKRSRRKIAHRGHPTAPVRYISLRRTIRAGEHEPAGSRAYSHQWLVGGHWRNQWYRSKGVHRPIYIHPYIKGPEGAPLLHAEKVYTLTR